MNLRAGLAFMVVPYLLWLDGCSVDERTSAPTPTYSPSQPVPNSTESEACKEIYKESLVQARRWSAADVAASSRHLAELERLENSSMSETQKEIAKNNLMAKQGMEDTVRENKQNNEFAMQTQKLKTAGCLGKTDPKKYGF